MQDSSIRQVLDIAARVFKVPVEQLGADSSAQSVDNWDSMGHAIFISELEVHFGIRFTLSELVMLSSIQEIADNINAKTHAN